MKRNNNTTETRNRRIAETALSIAKSKDFSLKEAFELAELIVDYGPNDNDEVIVPDIDTSVEAVLAEASAPASAPDRPQTREEALTIAYGDKEQRKKNVSKMKSCYDESWSNWVAYRDAHKDAWTRAQIKAANQTVSNLSRKAGYAGEVLKKGFFADLMAQALA